MPIALWNCEIWRVWNLLHNGSILCMNKGIKKWFQLIVDLLADSNIYPSDKARLNWKIAGYYRINTPPKHYVKSSKMNFSKPTISVRFNLLQVCQFAPPFVSAVLFTPSFVVFSCKLLFFTQFAAIRTIWISDNFRDNAPLNHRRRLNRTTLEKASNFSIS